MQYKWVYWQPRRNGEACPLYIEGMEWEFLSTVPGQQPEWKKRSPNSGISNNPLWCATDVYRIRVPDIETASATEIFETAHIRNLGLAYDGWTFNLVFPTKQDRDCAIEWITKKRDDA